MRLVGLGSRRIEQVDIGYVVHNGLRGLFGAHAPQPFLVLPGLSENSVRVVGYCGMPHESLRRIGERGASPSLRAACDWNHMNSTEMLKPSMSGVQLAFQTRVCPTVRMAKSTERHRKGAEVDAFLAACWKAGDRSVKVDRATVYLEWLARELARDHAATLLVTRMVTYRESPAFRRTQRKPMGETGSPPASEPAAAGKRVGVTGWRPDAWLAGTLTVDDPDAFFALLRRGLGRQRAFGFGMLHIVSAWMEMR